ncbi:hypothetical protein [Pelagicoccus sp. SDUM812003]|uniref:hypothetical protein n=1 Tax=Pelagicoccus sp. SDUM812003 TaxID=3041267 RepID=UPI00280F6598|nr:hypothetical protein [Pelagicoccus sp. SDUM812003]MDQ8205774.1 hypothetical protein [Pelagicoccus sp. SDUM812003]
MNYTTPEDLELLKSIRGSFRGKKTDTIVGLFFAVLMMTALPSITIYTFLVGDGGLSPTSIKDIFFVALNILSIPFGIFLWRFTGMRYEFDGERITHRFRNGKAYREIRISDLIEVTKREEGVYFLRTERSELSLVITKELQKEIAEQVGRHNSGQRSAPASA